MQSPPDFHCVPAKPPPSQECKLSGLRLPEPERTFTILRPMSHELESQEDSTTVLKMLAEYLIAKSMLEDDAGGVPPILVELRMTDMRVTVHSGRPAELVRQLLVMQDVPFVVEN